MINQIGATVWGCDDGVVALSTLTYRLDSPMIIGTHEFHAACVTVACAVVHHIRCEDGIVVSGIFIGSIGIGGAEDAHLVATVR